MKMRALTTMFHMRFVGILILAAVGLASHSVAHEVMILPQESDEILVFVAPEDHLSPTSIDFGDVHLGSSADEPVTVTNTDSRALTVTVGSLPVGVSVTPSQFSLAAAGTAGDSAVLQVTYSATVAGAFAETVPLEVQHQGVAKPKVEGIALEGTVVDINGIVQDSVDFGLILVDNESTETVTVTNTSQYSVTITPPASLPADMDISPSQVTLAPAGQAGDSSTFDLTRLATATAGSFSGEVDFVLEFAGVAGTSEEMLSYSGEIVDPLPVVLAPTSLSFGFIPFHHSVEKQLTISNPGTELLTFTPAAATESSGVILSETNPTPIPGQADFVLGVTVQAGGTAEIITGTIDVEVTYDGIAGSSLQSVPFEAEAGPEVYTPIASPRGYRPNQPFQVGEIDTIDTASGNVTIRVPLGQVYEVGPLIRYQFTVVNNSNAWDFIPTCDGTSEPDCPTNDELNFAVPNAGSNAGLGWELHFGKLFAHDPPAGLSGPNGFRWPNHQNQVDISDDGSASIERWLFVAPDGTRHTLHALPGRENGSAALPWRYSKDGSFIRMRQITSDTTWVEFPDGRYSVFKKVGNTTKGTDFCGNGVGDSVNGCWRLESINDRFGNNITFSYQLAGDVESWIVKDSTNRQHVIRFDVSNSGTAGGDGTGTYTTQDGDEWGDLRRVVDKVELAGFSGTATYDFKYTTQTVGRSCPTNPNGSGWFESPDPEIQTRILDEIVMPGGTPLAPPWKFETDISNATGCADTRGKVTKVTLPTRGKIQYVYSNNWEFPTRCDYRIGGVDAPETHYVASGIRERRILKPNDSVESKWTYSTDIFPPIAPEDVSGTSCQRAKYRKTTVDGPSNIDSKYTRTVSYHSIWEGPWVPMGDESGTGWQVTDHGLPYSKHASTDDDDLDRLFLSSQTHLCGNVACNGPSSSLVRSVYRRFVSEFRGVCNKANGTGDGPACFQINPIQLAQRTVYHDDGGRYVETRGSDFDGVGHFRTVATEDDFSGTLIERSIETEYTATDDFLDPDNSTGYVNPPANYLPGIWILTPYKKVTKTDDDDDIDLSYVTETEFNNGVLTCSRTWKNQAGDGRSGQDLVVKLTLNGDGLPTKEQVSGGETASLSTGDICEIDTTSGSGSLYTFDHTYQHQQLASTRIGSHPYRYRADIDQNTGLPSTVYNEADESATLTFDLLGRLTKIEPAAIRNEADTVYTYSNPTDGNPSMTVTRPTNLAIEKTTYDHLGRPIIHGVRYPETGAGFAERHTVYDAAGNVVRETTRQKAANVSPTDPHSWRHSLFDAFGRPGKTLAPDGKETKYFHFGDRATRVESGPDDRERITERDAWGRTISDDFFNAHKTTFEVDPNGNVLKATRSDSGVDQSRVYGYDARGYLLSEDLPEISDTVYYKPDALGLPRRVDGGGRDLKYLYDGNGRLLLISDFNSSRVWKKWAYGTANDSEGDGQAKGRLIEAIRYNYPPNHEAVAIVEKYKYFNGTAGPSSVERQVEWPDRTTNKIGPMFATLYDYDLLGNISKLRYPKCEPNTEDAKPCQDGNDVVGPSATLAYTYKFGLMVGAGTGDPDDGLGVSYSYHPNLQLASANFDNGVIGTYSQGAHLIARPGRRVFKDETNATLFDSGAYNYDASGNITAIGTDVYEYDEANRLLSATVKKVAEHKTESYTYDNFDNLTSTTSDFLTRTFQIDPATNRITSNSEAPIGEGGTEAVFGYDLAGNVTSIGPGAMQYDDMNMQTHFLNGPDHEYVSIYGPGDYRVWVEDVNSGIKYWTSRDQGGRILSEYEVTGDLDAWTHDNAYLYGAEGVVLSYKTGATRYFHPDHLGTPRLFTTGQGVEVGKHHYYAYGREACFTPDPGNPSANNNDCDGSVYDEQSVKFTGHQRELNENQYYMRGRHYINFSYRFGSVDPVRDGWNLYGYVGGNPVNFTDPTGLYLGATNAEVLAAVEALTPEQKAQFYAARESAIKKTAGAAMLLTPGPEELILVSGMKLLGRIGGAVSRGVKGLFGKADTAMDAAQAAAKTAESVASLEKSISFQKEALRQTRIQLDNGRNQVARMINEGGAPNPHGLGKEVYETLPAEIEAMERRIRALSQQLRKLKND